MIDLKQLEVWFVTGSQHLYGSETLEQVGAHATTIARALDAASTRLGISPSDVLFIAFCEVYGKEFPALKAKYEKWRELNLTEAA